MTVKRCPSCAELMVQKPYIISAESIMFWVCPEGDWEEPVTPASASSPDQQKPQDDT